MNPVEEAMHKLEAERTTAVGTVQVVCRAWVDSIDSVGASDAHRLELTLLPRSAVARGCFPDYWGPHRFEPIGEVFLVPARQMLHAKSECRQQSSIVCSFPPEAVQAWFDRDLKWTDNRLRGSLDIANPVIRSLMFRLGEEIRNPGFAGETLIELMAAQIAIELARHCKGIEDAKAAGGLAPWRLRLIDERLAEMGEAPTLTELARLCNLSERQSTRAFRASRGCSIGTHIANSRIDQAKQLLAVTPCVKSVAYTLGFNTPSNFSVAFHRATGETPRQYQQRTGTRAITH